MHRYLSLCPLKMHVDIEAKGTSEGGIKNTNARFGYPLLSLTILLTNNGPYGYGILKMNKNY